MCYLLNGKNTDPQTNAWFQNLDNGEETDAYPVPDATHGAVYTGAEQNCDGTSKNGIYTNTQPDQIQRAKHAFGEDGLCTGCGGYEPAVWNEADNHYEISNAGQLFWFAALVNGDNAHAEFDGKNAAASAVLMNDITIPGGCNWTSIGSNYSNQYTGAFDGAGHTIDGMVVSSPDSDNQGFVGYLGAGGTIRNLTLGKNCSVTSSGYVGGVCGFNQGAIQNCVNNGDVTGDDFVGGVCGYSNGGAIENCVNNGSVTGGNEYVGGVCGYGTGTLTNCTNTGTITGSSYVGGVCGDNGSETTITNCTNTGAVSGGSRVGGICGSNYGTLTNCYWLDTSCSTGIGSGSGTSEKVEAKTAEQFASGEVCYLLNGSTSGDDNAWRQNLGESADTCPVPDSTHGIVYPTYRCDGSMEVVGYNNNGAATADHDYVDNGFCTVCGVYEPAKQNEDNVYEISNAGQLFWFAALVNGTLEGVTKNAAASAVLTTDITIPEGHNWTSMGSNSNQYTGTFDGAGYTIDGMVVNSPDSDSYNLGFVGSLGAGGTIQNLTMGKNCSVIGNNTMGILCGFNQGTIQNCTNNGTINGSGGQIGGVCGSNSGTIQNCTNNGAITGFSSVGGVCGINLGNVQNCANTGAVSGDDAWVGGVCGQNSYTGSFTSCYNTGTVTGGSKVGGVCGLSDSNVTNCYWLDTSCSTGIGEGSGEATSKTAEEFASGEVCWLLNGESADGVWRQTLGCDAFPNFTGLAVSMADDGKYVNQMGDYSLQGTSLSLAGDVGVNFYMQPTVEGEPSDVAGLTMKFTLPNGTTEESQAEQKEVGNETYYTFTCHVAAKEMTRDITAQLYKEDGTAASSVYTYTVRDYADYILEHSDTYIDVQDLVEAMLNYGGYAQTYFNYHTDDLASEGVDLTTEMNDVTAQTLAKYVRTVTGSVAGITYKGNTLLLEANTDIRYYFTLAEGADITAYTFAYGDEVLTPVAKDGMYYVQISDIPAADLDQTYTLTVSNAEGSKQTIDYSVYAYAYEILNSGTYGTALDNVVKALYLYGVEAADYAANIDSAA